MNRPILLLLVMISSLVHFPDRGLCKRANARETRDYERNAASNAGADAEIPRKGGKVSRIEYEIQDLGTLGADTGRGILTMPNDINADGQIVGYSLTSDGHQHAFLWEPGKGIRDLGTLGYERSAATCINNYGKIAGYAGDNEFGPHDPDLISPPSYPRTRRLFVGGHDGGIRLVGEVIDKSALNPLHIDSSGDVIGYLYPFVNRDTELFVWSAEKGMSTITIGLPEAVERLQPLGGNSCQQVVGYYVDTENRYAFLWDRANGLTDLSPALGSKYCEAHAINDKGQIIGQSFTRSKRQFSAFMWDKTTGVRELGVLGGHWSSPNGLNNFGTVVGSSKFDGTGGADGARWHAFLWSTSTGMIDLNEALHESSVFLCLESALDINDAGQIIGYGRIKNGQRRGFVMSPVGTEH